MISQQLLDPAVWDEFLDYKIAGHHLILGEEDELRAFIANRGYVPVVQRMFSPGYNTIPEKRQIQKIQNGKKRTVYLYPWEENYVLKLLTYLLIRKYDSVFCDNLYSFRVHFGVSRAVSNLLQTPNIDRKYCYKADISNYFNSIPPAAILEKIKALLEEDLSLYAFFERMLLQPLVRENGRIYEENKGVMAGTPTAVFFANLYLANLDEAFSLKKIPYARYSDDIIFFADTKEECASYIEEFHRFLDEHGLTINPEKEQMTAPGSPWTFLGITYDNGQIDVSRISVDKIKDKIRRKARAIKRWQVKKDASDLQAMKAFLKSVNRKFFDAPTNHEMTWTRWYFPILTTEKSLHEIDLYVQEWARFLMTGKHTKKNFDIRYQTLKENGYISLVHAYYTFKNNKFTDS